MKNCLFVFNPISGSNGFERDEIVEMLEVKLPNFTPFLVETTGEKDDELVLREFQKHQPELVIIGGGDGTVKMVAKSLKEQDVPLAIIPMGSANGLAKCMGIDMIADGWEAVRDFKVHNIDAIHINGELCLHLADFGMNANLIKKFEEDDSRGMFGYFKNSLSEIFTSESKKFKLKLDNETIDITAKMIVIANGDKYGTGAIINCKGIMDDGKFEVISLNPESAEDYVKVTVAFMKGDLDELEAIYSWSVSSCHITNLEGAKFQIDGEMMNTPETVTATIEKHAFKFVTGKSFKPCQISSD
ncbi:diacylglycerol kinase family protein [Algoriphagus sp. D3-2-R+10]|uniref:diacylglycerol/lipid kinase family protein n=1 Tax=Algoriphagus aurantiacus TaxID=3103948 RepID=UPI002B397193|nr:diacylglycerol kinase family protein [Algoriphagus sp. D3-2-R+10]MEB2777274.1 diacylglycerol kinase family protein [Algoriphagus sp. D3-2-R+10]